MSPLAVFALGALANFLAVALTHVFAPDWVVMVASATAFLVGAWYQSAATRARLEALIAGRAR